ncbi:MAG TPA: hypothetical protein VF817_00110 [Patescibacteria group bacterium]
MYWIYLIIFSIIVYIPSLVRQGAYGFSVVQTQEFTILLLGTAAFALYVIQEKRYNKQLKEKSNIIRQVNRMSKDLTHSYSYIGEINRKLDILENIALGFPESSKLNARKESEMFDSIMGAIHTFSRSDDFMIRFVNQNTRAVLKDLKSDPKSNIDASVENCNTNAIFFENEEYIVAHSPRAVDGIGCCIIIRKKTTAHTVEDPEIMKTLAAQALFMFVFTRNKNHIKCVM